MSHCMTGGATACACAKNEAAGAQAGIAERVTALTTTARTATAQTATAQINGVPLHAAGQSLPEAELRQRACSELLRQAAVADGLLSPSDTLGADGVMSEAASAAIEALLARQVAAVEPSESACARHHAANAARYQTGERVRLRHILFAVTPGVDVAALRQRAETALLDVRCHDSRSARGQAEADAAFARAARESSNCPSGAEGGELGWLTPPDCAPEFAREIFSHPDVGVLPRLVHSRFGLHVVEVLSREAGVPQPYEAVRSAVAQSLRQQAFVTALRQYLSVLAGQAVVEGVELDAADTPLVQ
jgi:peptidyl-prolyl cis-trans isomerase C